MHQEIFDRARALAKAAFDREIDRGIGPPPNESQAYKVGPDYFAIAREQLAREQAEEQELQKRGPPADDPELLKAALVTEFRHSLGTGDMATVAAVSDEELRKRGDAARAARCRGF